MRILSFVGTRPEIIKTLALTRAARAFPRLELLIVHTGQNSGSEMADGFFRELKIPLTARFRVDRSTPGAAAKSLLDGALACIRRFKPAVVLSNTDTDTAFFAALAGARAGAPVAHIEGGIRCEARSNPEEINRRLADGLARWIFAISPEDRDNLLAEGFPRRNVFVPGDITLDALKITLKERSIRVAEGSYDLLTVHRRENADDPRRLAAILDAVVSGGVPTVFPVHPRTRRSLEACGLWRRLARMRNIEPLPPAGYERMLRLLAGCRKVLSDSGGLRREAYMLGKPVISLVPFVWFRRMEALGFEFVADADASKIAGAIRRFAPKGPRPSLFGDGRASERILRALLARAG